AAPSNSALRSPGKTSAYGVNLLFFFKPQITQIIRNRKDTQKTGEAPQNLVFVPMLRLRFIEITSGTPPCRRQGKTRRNGSKGNERARGRVSSVRRLSVRWTWRG